MNIQAKENQFLWKLQSAVAAVHAIADTETGYWALYLQAIGNGLKHLSEHIPPTIFPLIHLESYPQQIWGELIITAAMPVSLYNGLLPYKRKLGFNTLRMAYPSVEIPGFVESFELLSYWHHDLMCGKSLKASLLEIVHEDKFLTDTIRVVLNVLEKGCHDNDLARTVLKQAVMGQYPLLSKVLQSCYLCLSQATLDGIQREAAALRLGEFESATAAAMQAVIFCNELNANQTSLSADSKQMLLTVEKNLECKNVEK